MKIVKSEGALGAEVSGVQLAHISDAEFAQLRDVFFEHGVLFARDQEMTPEQHLAFARRWGNININRFFKAVEGYPEIAEVRKEPDQTVNIGGAWHTDHSYDLVPAMGSILRALVLPPKGGDTLFASMALAYEALDDAMKTRLGGLKAHHSSVHVFGKDTGVYATSAGDDVAGRIGNAAAANQDVVHDVVLTHPVTGRKGIYVNPGFTVRILGVGEDESQDLLTQLYAHCEQEQFVTRFCWRPGSLAMWDNRATWHNAMNDYHGHRRLMHRITLDGEALNGSCTFADYAAQAAE